MYNLLMVGAEGYWEERDRADFEFDRFLSYTNEALRSQFLPTTDEAIAKLIEYPALFTYEFPSSARAAEQQTGAMSRVGNIVEVRRRQRELQFKFQFNSTIDPIPAEVIRELAWDLDIDVKNQENYRSHWALKDVDLLDVLKKRGLITDILPVAPEVAQLLEELAPDKPRRNSVKPKVFVVHGRNDEVKNDVARWLARIGLDEIILHEQPNGGRTLISKFQEVAAEVAFAVVLMTPDDVGGLAGGDQTYRARQNVIFELGFFIGKLGPARVAALLVGSIETPSDYDGVAYISYDKRGAWKLELAREFKALGFPFDPLA
jgi:predicted nucleotide-binding protein